MAKRSEFISAIERIAALPQQRQEKIRADAARIVSETRLAEIRKKLKVTQVQAAKRAGLKQSEFSRIERSPETVQMRTLARYAESLGGRMKVVLEFPDGSSASIGMRDGKPVQSEVKSES